MLEYIAYLLVGFVLHGVWLAMMSPDTKRRCEELREANPIGYPLAVLVTVHIWPITVAKAIGALLAKPFTKATNGDDHA